MEWLDSYSVGNSMLDDQNQKLLKLFDELEACEKNGWSLGVAITALTWYAHHHFPLQEELLHDCGVADIEDHLAAHRRFQAWLAECAAFRDIAGPGATLAAAAMLAFLRDWWQNHILVEDMKFKAVMVAR
ncbi:MAG: bacteriohemerythrin [Magnetospiraceae bacterium]